MNPLCDPFEDTPEGRCLFRLPTVADLLYTTESTLRQWISTGRVSSVKIGTDIYIRGNELIRLLEQRRKSGKKRRTA